VASRFFIIDSIGYCQEIFVCQKTLPVPRTKSKPPFSEATIMRHPFDIKTPDATFLALNQPHIFGPFFAGYLELLKKKLSQVDFIGTSGQKYSYHTCGQDHYRGNPNWKPWQHLEWYCDQQRYQFYEARDMIFSRVGRKFLSRVSLSCNLGFYNIFVPAFCEEVRHLRQTNFFCMDRISVFKDGPKFFPKKILAL